MNDDEPRTRTRMPGSARERDPGRRGPSLSLFGALLVVGGIVAVLVFAGNRSPGEDDPPRSEAAATQDVTAPRADARPPQRVVDGVGVGYGRTREGAASAAANYLVAYGSERMFQPAARRAIVQAIGDPNTLPALLAEADRIFTAQMATFKLDANGNPPKGLDFVCRALPVGTKAVSYSETTATVEVWSAGIIGLAGEKSTQPVAEAWSTTTMRLVWVQDDWKLAELSQRSGPTPISGLQAASSAEEIAKAAREFEELRYAR